VHVRERRDRAERIGDPADLTPVRLGLHAIGVGCFAHARAPSAPQPYGQLLQGSAPDTLVPWLIDQSGQLQCHGAGAAGAAWGADGGPAGDATTTLLAMAGAAVCLGIADKIEPGDKLEVRLRPGPGADPADALGDALTP
jgi:hypothetical protein